MFTPVQSKALKWFVKPNLYRIYKSDKKIYKSDKENSAWWE